MQQCVRCTRIALPVDDLKFFLREGIGVGCSKRYEFALGVIVKRRFGNSDDPFDFEFARITGWMALGIGQTKADVCIRDGAICLIEGKKICKPADFFNLVAPSFARSPAFQHTVVHQGLELTRLKAIWQNPP